MGLFSRFKKEHNEPQQTVSTNPKLIHTVNETPVSCTKNTLKYRKYIDIPFGEQITTKHTLEAAGISTLQATPELLADIDDSFVWDFPNILYGAYGKQPEDVKKLCIMATINESRRRIGEMCRENEFCYNYLLNHVRKYALVKGIADNNLAVVSNALNNGANPNQRCMLQNELRTPIVLAAAERNLDITKILVLHGANVNFAKSNKETALGVASNQGDVPLVKYLLAQGADPNYLTRIGTSLSAAHNAEVVRILLNHNANPNIPDSDGDLPIIGFIDHGDIEAIRLLLQAGTDITQKNHRGISAKEYAMKSTNNNIRNLFI